MHNEQIISLSLADIDTLDYALEDYLGTIVEKFPEQANRVLQLSQRINGLREAALFDKPNPIQVALDSLLSTHKDGG